MRLDLLLRALNIRPDPDTVAQVGQAVAELVSFTGDPEVVALRYERAVKASLAKLDGPDGARAAVAMARLAVELGQSALAFTTLVKAMGADGDIDEYLSLSDLVPTLVGDDDDARHAASQWVESVRTAADRPYSSVGPALLRLASRVATALGEARLEATLLIQAVKRAPDDDALVDEADRAVAAMDDEELRKAFEGALPPSRKVEALLHLAEQHEREGQDDLAIEQLTRAIASGDLRPEAHERATRRLRTLLHQRGRLEDADVLLRDQLDRGELSPEARSHAARELAASIARRGDTQGALEVLVGEAQRGAVDAELLVDLKDLAGFADDGRRYAELLGSILEKLPRTSVQLPILRELAPLADELGDHAAAVAHYEALSLLDPSDEGALEKLEQDANERSDHTAIAELLGRRINAATSPERKRMLHLRRAAVLEQRLGRLDDAASELELLLAEVPDDMSALRFLTDIQERLGASKKAGVLLRRLGDLASTSDEKADYGLRASAAYIAADDFETAEDILESVAPIAERESVLELRVELARRRGDARALSDELDRLAACSPRARRQARDHPPRRLERGHGHRRRARRARPRPPRRQARPGLARRRARSQAPRIQGRRRRRPRAKPRSPPTISPASPRASSRSRSPCTPSSSPRCSTPSKAAAPACASSLAATPRSAPSRSSPSAWPSASSASRTSRPRSPSSTTPSPAISRASAPAVASPSPPPRPP
jgi:hypothetical protein